MFLASNNPGTNCLRAIVRDQLFSNVGELKAIAQSQSLGFYAVTITAWLYTLAAFLA